MTRIPLAGALALALLLITGCGDDTSAREDSEQQRPRPRAGAKATPSPTSTTPTSKPSGGARERRAVAKTASPKPSGNALTVQQTPDAHLIGAKAWGARWSVEGTRAEGNKPASDCQRATLHDIGAMETRVRDFAADGPAASQAVSRFGDGKSAWRAEQVMIAWRKDCADQLRGRDAALGTVRHGVWLSVVEVTGSDQPKTQLRKAVAAVEATF